MLHSKSSEDMRCLFAKKRVKHKVLITENDPAPLTCSHLIQKDTPVAWRNRHETHKISCHDFTTKADVRLLLAAFFEFAHKLQHTGSELYGGPDGDCDHVYSSHKSIVLPWKTWNINIFLINYDCSCICMLYLVFYWQMIGLGAGVVLCAHKCVK